MYCSLLETNKSEQKYTNIKPHKPNTAGCVRLIDVSWTEPSRGKFEPPSSLLIVHPLAVIVATAGVR